MQLVIARDIVATLSQRKARAAAEHYREGTVIASDTLVSYQGAPLGKPADAADAFRMLKMLSGNTHEVFTGVTLLDAASGRALTRVVRTGVTLPAAHRRRNRRLYRHGRAHGQGGRLWHTGRRGQIRGCSWTARLKT